MTRAIVFDFDGVLVDSVNVKTEAYVRLFEDEKPEILQQIVTYHLENSGVSRVEKFRYYYGHLLRRHLSDKKLDELCRRFEELVLERVVRALWVPGALEALEGCRQNKLLMFIASGTPEDELRVIAQRRGLSSYFHGIYGSPAVKPEIIRSILSTHKLKPSEVLFVGDGMTDYEAAQATGTHFVARGDPENARRWSNLGVAMLPDLRGLPEYIERF